MGTDSRYTKFVRVSGVSGNGNPLSDVLYSAIVKYERDKGDSVLPVVKGFLDARVPEDVLVKTLKKARDSSVFISRINSLLMNPGNFGKSRFSRMRSV